MLSMIKPQKKTLVSTIGIGAAALLLGVGNHIGFTQRFEGFVLKGYLDPVGIPTKCIGDTYDVEVGKPYTNQECKESLERGLLQHSEIVLKCAPELAGNEFFLAASIDLAYNVGAETFCNSSIEKAFAKGDNKNACKFFNTKIDGVTPAWVYVKDGKDSAGNWKYKTLPGLIKRANARRELCEMGL